MEGVTYDGRGSTLCFHMQRDCGQLATETVEISRKRHPRVSRRGWVLYHAAGPGTGPLFASGSRGLLVRNVTWTANTTCC